MKKIINIALVFTFVGIFSFVQAGDDNKEYVIKSYMSKSNNKVFVVICRNGTTMCDYSWDELCKEGKAVNSDPEGNETSAPAYMRNNNNVPMRVFVCK